MSLEHSADCECFDCVKLSPVGRFGLGGKASGITREMAVTALVNLHHTIRGEDCPREAAIGCATSAVQQLKRERDELRELLKSGFAYVRDANRLMAEDGDLDEEDEDGANEWLEKAAAVLVVPR